MNPDRFRFPMLQQWLALLTSAAPLHATEPPVEMTHAVLVHGIWQSKARCFGWMRRDLEKRGVTCVVPSLKPADGRDGIGALALQLRREINHQLGSDQHFVLIGFSMGGLVSRLYLQDLGGAPRCDTFITISSPHHGTRTAHLHYGQAAAEMRPGSVFLTDLANGESRLGKLPVVSYRTPFDAVIVPNESSIWKRAENIETPCPLHPMMTASRQVRDDILRRFRYPDRRGD